MTRRRALSLVFGLLIVVFVVSSIITVVVVRQRLIESVDNDLRSSLDATALVLDRFDVDDALGLDVESSERALLVFDGRTEVGYLPAGPSAAPFARPDITASMVVARTGVPFTVDAVGGGLEYRVLTTELDDGRHLALAAPLDDLRDVLVALSRYLLGTLLAVVLVLGLLFWLILRASLRPYDDMIETAEAIAAGDLGRRATATAASPEIEHLAASLNTMLDRIQDSFSDKESAESRLKQFVADASHELRTPLTSIRGYSELYLSGAATDGESVTKQMTRINDEAGRMGRLVDELLALARLDERAHAEHEPVDLAALVRDAVSDARASSPADAVVLADTTTSAIVDGVPDLLRQMIANLLANARVHTPDGTTVRVALADDDRGVRLSVADDGLGMDADTAAHVFDRFYRADKARVRRPGGSGLGLSIVADIVHVHGGAIELDTAPGAGATFSVRLPRCGADPSELRRP